MLFDRLGSPHPLDLDRMFAVAVAIAVAAVVGHTDNNGYLDATRYTLLLRL